MTPIILPWGKQTNKPYEYLLSYGWIYSKPTSHAWAWGLSDWRNLPIDMACAISSGYEASHGSTWWKVHGTAGGSRRWLPLQWPRAEQCFLLLKGPRNERAYSAKLLLWEKSREVFQTIACSTKTLNIPMWGKAVILTLAIFSLLSAYWKWIWCLSPPLILWAWKEHKKQNILSNKMAGNGCWMLDHYYHIVYRLLLHCKDSGRPLVPNLVMLSSLLRVRPCCMLSEVIVCGRELRGSRSYTGCFV